MKSTEQESARAAKLCDVLNGLGYKLQHAQSLEIVSKLDREPEQDVAIENAHNNHQLAEQLLSELLDAKRDSNFEEFYKRMDKDILENATEKRFLRGMRNLNEDFGPYVNRKYLGTVSGSQYSTPEGKYHGNVRHIWRGVFENHEVIMTLGFFIKDGEPVVTEMLFQ